MKQKTSSSLYKDLWDFIKDLVIYFFCKIRLFFVLSFITGNVIVDISYDIKRFLLRYMFWGRVKGYRVVFAGLLIFLLVVVPFVFYRDPITLETFAEETDIYDTVAQNDLLIEHGSSQTLIPKTRSRMDVTVYTVQRGDTLSGIATHFDVSIETILWANNLESVNLIKPGMDLKIPPGNGVLHKVGAGDTLSSLAEKYKASEQAIADINWIDPPFVLADGAVLFIPDGTMPPPPAPIQPVVATQPVSNPTPAPAGGGNTGTYNPAPSASRFLGWPVAGGAGRVTQCFSGWHNGVDIADAGWPNLVAAAPGTVTFAGCQSGSCPAPGQSIGGYGLAWSVIIDHGNGYSTVYGHMNQIYVSSGQYVGAGTAIGQMGRSGTATGVHIHFMVVRSGTWAALNPAQFMTTSICGW